MTQHRSHLKWWGDVFPINRTKIKNMNLKKYLPLIGCWIVVALLMGWFVFVSNDLMSAEQAIDYQCEQIENDIQQWHTLTNNQLFPR